MKRGAASIFPILLGVVAVAGRCAASPTPDEIAEKLQASLSQLDSLSYTAECREKDDAECSARLDWRERGDKCWLRFREWGGAGGEGFESRYSFDGERARRWSPPSSTVYGSRAPMEFASEIQNMQFITAPFDFVLNVEGRNPWLGPNLAQLKSDETWKIFARRSRVIGTETRGGRECVVLRVDGGRPRFFKNLSTSFVVALDPKAGFMPVAWKQFDGKARLVSELEVVKSADLKLPGGDMVTLPARLKVSFYAFDGIGGPKFYETPTNRQYFDYRDVSAAPVADERFKIDTDNATSLHDMDNKTTIDLNPPDNQ